MASPAKAVRELNDAELAQQLLDAKEELFNLRFQLATGKQDNSARMGRIRRDIARIHTVLREREIEAAESLAASEVHS
jgi:large subunit ribosomal protein L29